MVYAGGSDACSRHYAHREARESKTAAPVSRAAVNTIKKPVRRPAFSCRKNRLTSSLRPWLHQRHPWPHQLRPWLHRLRLWPHRLHPWLHRLPPWLRLRRPSQLQRQRALAEAEAEAARPQVLSPEPGEEEEGLLCRSPPTSALRAQRSVLSGSFLGSLIDKLSGIWRGTWQQLQACDYTAFCRRFTGRWWSPKRRGTNCPRFPKIADTGPDFPCRH